MLGNYIKIAFRNLLGKKGFSLINILGLSIGMTCCLLIFQHVAFEYSFDNFHQNKGNIYRVLQAYAGEGDQLDMGHSYTAQALALALDETVPEIQEVTRIHSDNAIVSTQARPGEVFEEDGILYADPGFMKMFTFPLISGDDATLLQPGTALLSASAAKKYFGAKTPEGEVLEITGAIKKSYRVTGIFHDVPANSHLQFDAILPMDDLLRGDDYSNEPEGGWSWNNFSTYVQLHEDAPVARAGQKMTETFLAHRGEVIRQQGGRAAIHIQPLEDIHLNSQIQGAGNIVTGSYRTVYFFLVVGLITLIIALVNYINLATARAVNRSREVGVRKVVGARRGQLVIQFLCESGLTNLIAAIIAIALAGMLIPSVNDLADTQLSVTQWMFPQFWIAFIATLVVTALLSGIYPAFVLSSFRPAAMLKGKSGSFTPHVWLRRGLVVLQFAASIVLIAGTTIVYDQLHYMRAMDVGLDLDHVLTVPAPRILSEGADRATLTSTFLQELERIPGVRQAATSSSLPGQGFNWNGAAIRKAADDPASAIRGVATYIDTAFASLYGLQLLAGHEFADVTISEAEDAPWMVMVNETLVRTLGFLSPDDAVDEALNIGGYDARIIGVYRDFNWSSAHEQRQNIVFGLTTTGGHFSLLLSSADLPTVIGNIQSLYQSHFPGNIFRYAFADDSFNQQYANDQRFASLFSIAAGMAIFIACLGLLGLVAFTAQQRKKEIGMRKVLGATITGIITLLSKDFLKLVLIGFLLAIPATWYIMDEWLKNFAYRTDISAGVFALSGLLAIFIALITVCWQSVQAALANPVDSLKNE